MIEINMSTHGWQKIEILLKSKKNLPLIFSSSQKFVCHHCYARPKYFSQNQSFNAR